MEFAADARWGGAPIGADDLSGFNAVFRPLDDDVCAWQADDDTNTLRISFNVEASNYELALQAAKDEVVAAASQCRLLGEVLEVVVMTDEGQARWAK